MRVVLDGKVPVATLGEWGFRPGTAPEQVQFVFPKAQARDLMGRAKVQGSKLELVADDPKLTKTVKRLTLTNLLPSDNPAYYRVEVSDWRYFWEYPVDRRAYNFRLKGAALQRRGAGPKAAKQVVPTVGFERWSLKDGKKVWTPKLALEDLLDTIAGKGGWKDQDSVLQKDLAPIEDFEVAGTHASMLAQLLAYFGEALSVWVDADGVVLLIDRAGATERELVQTSATGGRRPQVAPGPGWVISDRRLARPRLVRVRFVPLCEVRLDRKEGDGSESFTAPPPRLDDVLYLPEDLTVNGEDLAPSSLVTLDDFLAAIAGDEPTGPNGAPLPQVTRDLIRRGWTSNLLQIYAQSDTAVAGRWPLRVPAIRGSWRGLWQLRKRWRDRIRVVLPRRVAVLDPQTGTLGRAPVYSDHALEFGYQNPNGRREADLREDHELVQNVLAYPTNGPNNIVGTPIADLVQAPAVVEVVDPAQKVFRLDWQADPTLAHMRVYRSAFDPDTVPTNRAGDEEEYLEDALMTSEFEQSIIVSCVMGAPNDKRGLWSVDVKPSEVRDLVKHPIEPADGPVLEVLVSGARIPARFAWDDARAQKIYEAFDEGSTRALQDAYEGPVNQEQLEAVARAIAGSIYLQLADRVVGGLRTPLVDVELRGAAERVALKVDPQLGPITELVFPEDGLAVDAGAFLPTAVRRTIDFMVDPA